MKKDTHPTFHKEATVTCVCGTTYTIGSTLEDIQVEICGACHPFYTGKEKVLDTAGRVERFKARQQAAQKTPQTGKKVKKEKKAQKESEEQNDTEA